MTKRDHAPGYVPNPNYTQEDWDEVSDNPPLTDEELAAATPGPEGLPPAMADAFRKLAGRPKSEAKAVPVSLRVPPDVLAAYKADGPGWQTRMNDALAIGVRGKASGTLSAKVSGPHGGAVKDMTGRRSGSIGQQIVSRAAAHRQKRKPESA